MADEELNPIENDENQNQIDDAEEASAGMDAIDNFDFDRAMQLMSVMEKCATVGIKATSIAGLASAALNEMNEEAKQIAKDRAKAVKDLERLRDEALAAKARQRAEAEAQAKAEADEAARVPRPKAIPNPAPNGRRL